MTFFGLFIASHLATAENWPQFRGPNHNNLPNASNLPSDWSEDTNVKWKAPMPGTGWGSPIVWEDKIFVSTAVMTGEPQRNAQDNEHSLELHCLNLNSGDTLWKRVCYKGKPTIGKHRDNTYASETPVTDGERVYVYFGMMGLYCFDMDGNPQWDKDFGTYQMERDWGTSSSPLLFKENVYLQIDSNQQSFLVAVDGKTGDEKWRINRDEPSNWGSPIIWNNSQRVELIAQGITTRSYNPENGEEYWSLHMGGGRNDSSPMPHDDILYLGNEERDAGGNLFAVKAGGTGDITPKSGEFSSEYVLWMKPKAGVAMASPLYYDGYMYVTDRRLGILSCYDAMTGKTIYSRQRLPGGKPVWSTPWAIDGKVFCVDEAGTTFVVKAGATLEVLDTNKLNGKFWCTPAFTDNNIILRSVDSIYCIGD
jgi:outer membrane protein assembly factor BamB